MQNYVNCESASAVELKERVTRILDECEKNGGIAWVTSGKEIENYIPLLALRTLLQKDDLPQPGKDENVFEYIVCNGGRHYETEKPLLAERVTRVMDASMLDECGDLKEQVAIICRQIRSWNNRIEPSQSPSI